MVGDLRGYLGVLCNLVGLCEPKLKQFAFGEENLPLEVGDEIKSISCEVTNSQSKLL